MTEHEVAGRSREGAGGAVEGGALEGGAVGGRAGTAEVGWRSRARRWTRAARGGVGGCVSRFAGRFRGLVHDAGMATAEYAIVTLAAAGFAGVLIVLLRSDEVRGLLLGLVRGALTP